MTRLTLALLLVACTPTPAPVDAGEPPAEEEVAYEGDTAGGGLPGFIPGLIDAGEQPRYTGTVETDATCCKLTFSIGAGDEAPNAQGLLFGDVEPLSNGVPLVRESDGGWTAAACFPIEQSSAYWYQFEWPSSLEDGGTELLDGGVVAQLTRTGERNFIPSVTDCAALDASVGP